MATRTYKIKGFAYGETDVSVTIKFNNETVYTGAINTVASFDDGTISELASFTADTSVTGNIPMSILVNSGTLAFTGLEANYSTTLSPEQIVRVGLSEGQEPYEGVTAQNVYEGAWAPVEPAEPGLDYRLNVKIDEVNVTATSNPEKDNNDTRGFIYLVNDGETLTFDQVIDASTMPSGV